MSIDLERRTPVSAKIDSSGTNIPTSFDKTNASSLVISTAVYCTHLKVVNFTATAIAVNYVSGDPNNNPSTVQMRVPAKGTGDYSAEMRDDTQVSSCIYIKSEGSAISSGLVYIEVW